ncbi:MAG: exodeoxyribonuclease VII small subunit [Dehalococcoidia bacterium]
MAKADETFEVLYGQLEEKARKLEQGNLPLEESLKLYEEGASLVDRLRTILEGAELRVKTLQTHLEQDLQELREVESEYDEAFEED